MSHDSSFRLSRGPARRFGVISSLGLLVVAVSLMAGSVEAATRKVPQTYPTIQGAVDAAAAGDTIEVGKGKFCGATITKRLNLVAAKKGDATIIGCASSPILTPPLRVGFLLPGTAGSGSGAASGSKITGFVFDGKGISNSNLSPLAFGIYSRFNDHIKVDDNKFKGTVQAITNTAGDNWAISDNVIEDLTLFDCTGSFCGGGVGIAIQIASNAIAGPGGSSDPANRPEANAVVKNEIQGKAPAGFHVFGMDGILAFAADGTAIVENQTKITPGLSSSEPLGVGILVTNLCCDDPIPFLPGSRYTAIVLNQDHSQFGVVVEGTGGANTTGLVLFGNQGNAQVEGSPAAMTVAAASATTGRRTRFE
jgi:hypothetical protein